MACRLERQTQRSAGAPEVLRARHLPTIMIIIVAAATCSLSDALFSCAYVIFPRIKQFVARSADAGGTWITVLFSPTRLSPKALNMEGDIAVLAPHVSDTPSRLGPCPGGFVYSTSFTLCHGRVASDIPFPLSYPLWGLLRFEPIAVTAGDTAVTRVRTTAPS